MMAIIAGRGPAYLRGLNLSSMDLSNAGWLVEADLRNADLSAANLRRANLGRANLERANLHAANLLGTILTEANLQEARANVANLNVARLRAANLRGISLVSASLIRADLEEADLDGADLEGANLEGSNLRKARLTNVNFKMTNFEGADLTGAIIDGGMAKPAPAEKLPGFQGTISSIGLTDLVQLGCLSRSDLDIEVSSSAGNGNIYVGEGRILHASTGELEGEKALLTILGWDHGRFATTPRAPDGVVTIDKPIEHLLLQSVRLKDEKRLDGKNSKSLRNIMEQIPFKARVSPELLDFLGVTDDRLTTAETVEITDVFDSGDGEDILCAVSARTDEFIAPLKYIDLDNTHPLFRDLENLLSG